MRKIFIIFAAALIAFSFASCNKDPEPEPQTDVTFDIQVRNIPHDDYCEVEFTITPSSDDVDWYWNANHLVAQYESKGYKSYYDMATQDLQYEKNIAHHDYEYLKQWDMICSGKRTHTISGGYFPLSNYLIYVCAVDHDLNVISKVAVKQFTTLP